jgi:amino acid transporter
MFIVLGIFAAAALGGMIYLFLSPKSSRPLKLAALAALILSGLTIGVCSVLVVFRGSSSAEEDPYAFPLVVEEVSPASPPPNIAGFIIFLVILLIVFGLIIFLGLRDRKIRAVNESIAHTDLDDLDPPARDSGD